MQVLIGVGHGKTTGHKGNALASEGADSNALDAFPDVQRRANYSASRSSPRLVSSPSAMVLGPVWGINAPATLDL